MPRTGRSAEALCDAATDAIERGGDAGAALKAVEGLYRLASAMPRRAGRAKRNSAPIPTGAAPHLRLIR